MARNTTNRRVWKEPVVLIAGAVAIVIAVLAVGVIYRLAKVPPATRAQAQRCIIPVGEMTVDLDSLDDSAFAAILSQQEGHPYQLKLIEQALARSVREGRIKGVVPNIAPTAETRVHYIPVLARRVQLLQLLVDRSLDVDPASCFELALYSLYQEREAGPSSKKEGESKVTFGTAYDLLGAPRSDMGEYGRSFQLFKKIVEMTSAKQDKASQGLHALALGNLGVIHRARGDYRQAETFLAKADELLTSLGFIAEAQQAKRYMQIVRLETTSTAKE